MKWTWSAYGNQFAEPSGILELMRDLGEALAGGDPDLCMLGGGNPAAIPEVEAVFRERWGALAEEGDRLEAVLGKYDTAQGSPVFLEALATYLNEKYDWGIGPENIGITNGSQTAFFHLFNLLGGGGKKILLPLSPEYIGYADQGQGPGLFRAVSGRMQETGPHRFKYRMDEEALRISDDVAAIAVSRPTNPTGNVLTDKEIATLSDLALAHEIPLLIDNAYGAPFPGILFREVKPMWAKHIILSMSLSKLGLPGVRTGIIVADKPVIQMLTSVNAVAGLANGNVGQALAGPLLADGRMDQLCREAIRPFYETRSLRAGALWEEALGNSVPWMRHEAEGSMFHWIRFPGLPVQSAELYRILKQKGVLVVPGHFFFYGLDRDPPEKHECLRVHTAMNPEMTARGIEIIGETVRGL